MMDIMHAVDVLPTLLSAAHGSTVARLVSDTMASNVRASPFYLMRTAHKQVLIPGWMRCAVLCELRVLH